MIAPNATPVSGTKEWASSNLNIQHGCPNDCKYCYAKCMAIRFGRAEPETWKTPVPRPKELNKGFGKRKGTVMFPSTHDIDPDNIDECVGVLLRLLKPGNNVLIVSKPRMECIRRLCAELLPYRDQILFRFTIGTADDKVLAFWEPNAPQFKERLASLRHAFRAGFQTSVSMEPLLGDPTACIKACRPYVTHSIWLGRVNRLRNALAQNCPRDQEAIQRSEEMLAEQSDDAMRRLYATYKDDPVIKWKDSIKQIVGLKRPTEAGLDV